MREKKPARFVGSICAACSVMNDLYRWRARSCPSSRSTGSGWTPTTLGRCCRWMPPNFSNHPASPTRPSARCVHFLSGAYVVAGLLIWVQYRYTRVDLCMCMVRYLFCLYTVFFSHFLPFPLHLFHIFPLDSLQLSVFCSRLFTFLCHTEWNRLITTEL